MQEKNSSYSSFWNARQSFWTDVASIDSVVTSTQTIYRIFHCLHGQRRDRLDACLSSSSIKAVRFIRLREVCEKQNWCNLTFVDLLQACCWNNLHQACGQKLLTIQITSNLSPTCSRLVMMSAWLQGNKPATDLLQLANFWLCKQYKLIFVVYMCCFERRAFCSVIFCLFGFLSWKTSWNTN